MTNSPLCPLVVVDGNNLLWRAAYAKEMIYSSDGTRVITALVRFFSMMNKAIAEEIGEDAEVIVVFDSKDGAADRKEMFADYKGNREVDTSVLNPFECLEDIKAGLSYCSIDWMQVDGVEADDVVASIVKRYSDNRFVFVMSCDKDFFQLITPRVSCLNTMRPVNTRVITEDDVFAKYGVTPSQWVDFRALSGDPSDNIPGVNKIGPKTAAKFLAEASSIDGFKEAGVLETRLGKNVAEQWDQLLVWRSMIKLNEDVPLTDLTDAGQKSSFKRMSEIINYLNL
jgi:DNA polymerase-1